MFNKDKRWLLGTTSDCKECRRNYRLEHREHITSYLKNYYHSNREIALIKHAEYREKNRERIRKREKEYYREHAIEISQKSVTEELKFHESMRQKSKRLISRLWIRPKTCPICSKNEFRIEAHHPDYNKWNEIVFCCKSCHLLIHSWRIPCPDAIIDLCTIKNKDV